MSGYEVLRKPVQLSLEEWSLALRDLRDLGMVDVVLWPTEKVPGAIVTRLRNVQAPKLVLESVYA